MRADQHQNIGYDADGHLEPTTDFDFDSVDRNVFGVQDEEQQVDYRDMVAALSLVLGWACASPDIKHVGGRVAALMCMIDPVNAPHGRRDLTAIAKEVGVTKQAVSKWLADLRDQTGVSLTVGKKSSMREKYRAAQLAALERRTHSSFKRVAASKSHTP